MKLLIRLTGVVLFLCSGFYLGLVFPQEPEIKYVPAPYIEYVKIPELVYQDRIITVTENVTVEKIVEKPVAMTKWRDFESLEEFARWSEKLSVLWISGQIVDCDDYSEFVWDMAYKDGYRMSEPLVRDGKYFGVTVNEKAPHIGGQVQIGNKYYYFEPNPPMYRLIYICDRD